MPFTITAKSDVPIDNYFLDHVEPAVVHHAARGVFPSIGNTGLCIRISLDDPCRETKHWEIAIDEEGVPSLVAGTKGNANVEIVLSESDFRRSQFEEKHQLEYLRILQGNPKKFENLQTLTGQTNLSLTTKTGQPIKIGFVFNQNSTEQVDIRMSYQNFCSILKGKGSMLGLFAIGKIKHRGSLGLLLSSKKMLDPS